MANKAGKGGFKKGQSGNPGGRPKVVAEVRDLAQEHTEEAVSTLATIMMDEKAPHAARVAAANSILDRGYGKAPQHLNVTGKNDIAELLSSIDHGPEASPGEMGKEPKPVRH